MSFPVEIASPPAEVFGSSPIAAAVDCHDAVSARPQTSQLEVGCRKGDQFAEPDGEISNLIAIDVEPQDRLFVASVGRNNCLSKQTSHPH